MIEQQIAIFLFGILIGLIVLYSLEFITIYKLALYREKILRHREIDQYINLKKLNRSLKKTEVHDLKRVYELTKIIARNESQLKLTRSELNALLSLEEKE